MLSTRKIALSPVSLPLLRSRHKDCLPPCDLGVFNNNVCLCALTLSWVKPRGVVHSQTAGLHRSLTLGIFMCLGALPYTEKPIKPFIV